MQWASCDRISARTHHLDVGRLGVCLPPSLLAQSLQSQPAVPGGLQQQPGPACPGNIHAWRICGSGTSGQLGRCPHQSYSVANPSCPTMLSDPLSSDLNSREPSPILKRLLACRAEQPAAEFHRTTDEAGAGRAHRRREKLQAEKEKSSIEYQVQVEREKKASRSCPSVGRGAGAQPQLSQTPTQSTTRSAGGGPAVAGKEGVYSRSCCDSRTSMSKKPCRVFRPARRQEPRTAVRV